MTVRPPGFACGTYVYSDGKNAFDTMKHFLLDTASGRTDVVILATSATAGETNRFSFNNADLNDYLYTGNLIDGFAKAIIQGSATRTARTMYGTPVQFGFMYGDIPNFDRWDNATWLNPNTTGVGHYLTGCSTAYNSLYYYKHSTNPPTSVNSSVGYFDETNEQSINTIYYDRINEEMLTIPYKNVWAYSFSNPESFIALNATRTAKMNAALSMGFNLIANTSYDAVRDTILSLTSPYQPTICLTPEQPSRFWRKDNPWLTNLNLGFHIGIGYVVDGIITELFSEHNSYGYIPNALAVGQIATTTPFNNSSNVSQTYVADFSAPFTAFNTNWIQAGAVTQDAINTFMAGKKLLIRYVIMSDIITIRSLNICPYATTLTSEAQWTTFDGKYLANNQVMFRNPWCSSSTESPFPGMGSEITLLNSELTNQWGLATSSTSNASDTQLGLPRMYLYGVRFMSNSMTTTASPLVSSPRTHVLAVHANFGNINPLGFPSTLTTASPVGFFRTSYSDTDKLSNGAYTVDKSRCLVINPNLGHFFSAITVNGTGQNSAISAPLNNTQKTAVLGIFKSSNFKYCATAYTLNRYASDSLSTTNLVKLTAHYRTNTNTTLISLGSQDVSIPSPTIADTVPRTVTRTICTLPLNLSSINANFTIGEIRLGFLGFGGTSTNTSGDLLITTHYGVDAANQNGISFSYLETSLVNRVGDRGYQLAAAGTGATAKYTEFFRAIYDRQTLTNLGASTTQTRKKLVILYECGVWEAANVNSSYLGWNSWNYIGDILALTPNSSTGSHTYETTANALGHLINSAALAGFTRDEVVIVFYCPTQLTRVDTHSFGTKDGLALNTIANQEELITTKNKRATYARSLEIFRNTVTYKYGLYNPSTLQYTSLPLNNLSHKNSIFCHIGLIPGVTSLLNNIDSVESTWYAKIDAEGATRYDQYSAEGALALGATWADYIQSATTLSAVFAPFWVKDFTTQLGYDIEPVSGDDFSFITLTNDPLIVGPYLVEYYNLVRSGDTQANETLSLFKHKILQ